MIFWGSSPDAGWESVRYIVGRNPEIAKDEKGLRERDIKELDEQLRSLEEKVNRQKRISRKKTTEKVAEILRHHHGKRYFAFLLMRKIKDSNTGIRRNTGGDIHIEDKRTKLLGIRDGKERR